MARPGRTRRVGGKRAIRLDISSGLVEAARAEKIHLSVTLEHALENALRQARGERWLAKNAIAIAAYNRQLVGHGVFGDSLRSF